MMVSPEENARCWTCGYQLRGLDGNTCPECGRAFDPDDPATFDRRDPVALRRNRIRRTAIVLAAILLLIPIFPRRILRGKVTLKCGDCGIEQTTYRWEPGLPSWIGLRLPGVHWRTSSLRKDDKKSEACQAHNFNHAAAEIGTWGSAMRLSCTCDAGFEPAIDNQATNLNTTVRVLRNAMNPRNASTSITCLPNNPLQPL